MSSHRPFQRVCRSDQSGTALPPTACGMPLSTVLSPSRIVRICCSDAASPSLTWPSAVWSTKKDVTVVLLSAVDCPLWTVAGGRTGSAAAAGCALGGLGGAPVAVQQPLHAAVELGEVADGEGEVVGPD